MAGYFGLGRKIGGRKSISDAIRTAKENQAKVEAQRVEQQQLENEEKAINPILTTEQPSKRGSGGLLSLKTDITSEKESQLGKNRKFAEVNNSVGYVMLG